MNSHAHPNALAVRPRVPGERALCIQRSLHSIQRAAECDEKGIACGVDLVARMTREGIAQQKTMLR